MFPEVEELGPHLNGGLETQITLHECREGGEGDNGVGGEMVRLEAKEIKERVKEVGGGEAESPFKVCEEDHSLAGLRSGNVLLTG